MNGGSSFSQITPLTPRVIGIDYIAVPKPGQYSPAYYTYSIPEVSIASFASTSGTATLCGFSEYTTPSSPPKKYLRQDYSGTVSWCIFGNGACSGNVLGANRGKDIYTGGVVYDPSTCSPTNTGSTARYNSVGTSPCADNANNFIANSAISNPSNPFANTLGAASAAWDQSTSRTIKSLVGDPVCSGGSFGQIGAGSAFCELNDEDTEDDAIARSASTPGTANLAYRESRGAGDFTFLWQNSIVTVNATGLSPGINYRITLSTNIENYGGGSAVSGSQIYAFVASAESQSIPIQLDCPDGKQVSIYAVNIERA